MSDEHDRQIVRSWAILLALIALIAFCWLASIVGEALGIRRQ